MPVQFYDPVPPQPIDIGADEDFDDFEDEALGSEVYIRPMHR